MSRGGAGREARGEKRRKPSETLGSKSSTNDPVSEIIRGETLIDANASNLASKSNCASTRASIFGSIYESRRDCEAWNGMGWLKRMIRYMRILFGCILCDRDTARNND